jgi:putative methyltransferase (TIGR04325 family)
VIWSGVHAAFSDVPADDDGFIHPLWLEKSVARLQDAQAAPGPSPSAEYALTDAVLAASVTSEPVTVLDVGGNLGQSAISVGRRLPGVRVAWTVLEREDLLAAARAATELPREVTFVSDPAQLAGHPFDVVHLGSVLQYFEDWRGTLAELTTENTRIGSWLVISDAMVGADIPSFVTRQAYYERGLTMHFLNLGELVDHLGTLGFRLLLQEPYLTPHTARYYPEPDLPVGHRIDHPLNLVLRRTS